MTFEVFEHVANTAVMAIEKALDTKFNWTNSNGIKFSLVVGYANKQEIALHMQSYDEIGIAKTLLNEKKVAINGIVDAVLDIHNYIEHNRNFDHWDIVELMKSEYDNN